MTGQDGDKPKKKSGKETFKSEDVLQAVVIADSFNEHFKPITIRTARSLIPVANCPILEYTLDFLVGNDVKEIFIFCRSHAEKIRSYINEHVYWGPKGRGHRNVSVSVIVSEDCYSMGDALREIDGKNLIRGDFILVQGDLIANVDLKAALEAHKKRRMGTDKNSIMTLVCREVAPTHPARFLEEQLVLAVEPETDRVLHHLKLKSKGKATIPLDIFQGRDEIDIRSDLLDCGISICSPQVPPLFSDNFDYQNRDDFVRGILEHEEILGNSIHAFFLSSGYTARISNLHMYDVVTRDVIARWVFPLCPDMGFPHGEDYVNQTATYKRNHIYHQRRVTLAMGCILEENVIVGSDTSIGENTVVRNSVIGKSCRIGRDCEIDGAYIWDDCVIEDNCRLGKSVIASRCVIGNGTVLRDGCVLGYEVQLGKGSEIPGHTRLIGKKDYEAMIAKAEDSEDEKMIFDACPAPVEMIGSSNPNVFLFSLSDLREEMEDEDNLAVNLEEVAWRWAQDLEVEDLSESEVSDADDESEDMEDVVEDRSRNFFMEISETLMSASRGETSADNAILEINGSKFANNVTMGQLNKLMMRSIVEIPELATKETFMKASDVLSALERCFKKLKPIMKNYLKSKESQVDAIVGLEDCAVHYKELTKHRAYGELVEQNFVKLLHFMYEQDVLEEGAILEWYNEPANLQAQKMLPFWLHDDGYSSGTRRRHQSGDISDEEMMSLVGKIERLKERCKAFVTWLKEADEESEDESDTEEEDGEDYE